MFGVHYADKSTMHFRIAIFTKKKTTLLLAHNKLDKMQKMCRYIKRAYIYTAKTLINISI